MLDECVLANIRRRVVVFKAEAGVVSSSQVISPESELSSELDRPETRVSSFCNACTRRLVIGALGDTVDRSLNALVRSAAEGDFGVWGCVGVCVGVAGVAVVSEAAAAAALFCFFCFSISSSLTCLIGLGAGVLTGIDGTELTVFVWFSFSSFSFSLALISFWYSRSITCGESINLMMPLRGARKFTISSVSNNLARC